MTSASLMYEAGQPKPVLWDNPVGWAVKGGGKGVQDVHPWLIHGNAWQKPPQYCKIISFQLNQ